MQRNDTIAHVCVYLSLISVRSILMVQVQLSKYKSEGLCIEVMLTSLSRFYI